MPLRELGRAHKLTQERTAEILDIGQARFSVWKQRMLCSYVEAMGGRLKILAEFPHRKSCAPIRFYLAGTEQTPIATRERPANVKIPNRAKSA